MKSPRVEIPLPSGSPFFLQSRKATQRLTDICSFFLARRYRGRRRAALVFFRRAVYGLSDKSILQGGTKLLQEKLCETVVSLCLGESVKSCNEVSLRKYKCSIGRSLVRKGSTSFLVYKLFK